MKHIPKNDQYKFLPLLGMLFISLSLVVHLFRNKYVLLNYMEVAYLITPFWFLLNDLIAEVYGYKISMKIFWSMTVCELIFLAIYYCVALLPSSSLPQSSYYFVMGGMWDEMIINPFALWIAWGVNARLLIRWKILLKGRYFWLRSIGSSIIAELVFRLLIFPKLLLYFDTKYIAGLLFWSSISNLLLIVLFAFPCTLIATFPKIIERADLFENRKYFNPFEKES